MTASFARGPAWRGVISAIIATWLVGALGVLAFASGSDDGDDDAKSEPKAKAKASASAKPTKTSSAKTKAKAEDSDDSADADADSEKSASPKTKTRPAPKQRKSTKPDPRIPQPTSETVKSINELLEGAWKSAKVESSDGASDEEFLRRAYLDFLGRIPRFDEARTFLLNKEPDKRLKLIDMLASHPDFAKNFATTWRILLIGRGNADRDVNGDALETWLRRRFADNKPWNETVRELVAAKGSNKDNGAVNYTLAHMDNGAANLTSNTTRLFLGQQIQCTQCHDHPSNDWKQSHFWGINAFFKAIRSERHETVSDTGALVVDYVELTDRELGGDLNRFASYDRRDGQVRTVGPQFLDGTKVDPSVDVDRRKKLADLMTKPDNLDLPKAFVNRMWAHFMGRGIVHTVDDFGDHNPPSNPELLELLAAEFAADGFNVKNLARWIAASKAYHLSSKAMYGNDNDEVLYSHMMPKPFNPEQLYESLLIATNADKVGGGDSNLARNQFANQFVSTFANDDGEQSLNFQGTIPQALMMMNGDLIAKATSGQTGSFLRKLVDEAKLQRDPHDFILTRLYLSALSRMPNPKERQAFLRVMKTDPAPELVASDLFWALLNSNEFILNH